MKKEESEDKIIAARIIKREEKSKLARISEIAAAEPVLDLFIEYKVTKESARTERSIIPRRIRNCFGVLSFSFMLEEIIAACDEPNAGRNEQAGTEIAEER